jgi:hypothetical protein
MSNKDKAVSPPREFQKGAVHPEKPTKLPNGGQPRPDVTTTSVRQRTPTEESGGRPL